jgi:RNA polymerase sigma-B factor
MRYTRFSVDDGYGSDVTALGTMQAKRLGTPAAHDGVAREQAVRAHLPLVEALALRFASDVESVEDLRQVGVIGLLKAVDRYEPDRGTPFTAFAVPTILGELRHHVRDRAWPVRVPRRVRRREVELSRSPRIAVPLADEADLAARDELADSENRLLVGSLLQRLPRRERAVVARYFFADRSQAQIARELGISQIQVSRVLRGALVTMRALLDGIPR